MAVEFEATWPGTELGDYRPCGGTYQNYPYDSLPVLNDSRFTGAFDWLPDHGAVDPDLTTRIAHLDRQLSTVGLALPIDFVRYHSYTKLARMLVEVSGTGCYSVLLGPDPDESESLEDLPLRFRSHLCDRFSKREPDDRGKGGHLVAQTLLR